MGDGLSKELKEAQREADKEAEKYPEAVRENYRPTVNVVVEAKVVTSKPPMMEDAESGLEPEKKRENSAEQGTSTSKKQKKGFKASPTKGTRTGLRSETNANLLSQCKQDVKCKELDNKCFEITINNMKEFEVFKKWPAHEEPEKVIGVIPVDGVLTYIVKKKLSYELDYISELNIMVVHAADFRSKFPQLVIKYYQDIVLWNSETTPAPA